VRIAAFAGLLLWFSSAAVLADPVDHPADIEPAAQRSLLLDVARAGQRIVAVGERGHVLLSDDGGKRWTQSAVVPSRSMLTALCFADAQRGWAVGHDEIILNTVDAGKTWTRSHYAPESQQPLLDVLCVDVQHAIAVGAYGSYFVTRDAGASWTSHKFIYQPLTKPVKAASGADADIPPDYHLNRIAAVGGRLFIAAESGQLYRSEDGGASWVSLSSPYKGSFFGLLPLQGDALLAFGLRGNLFMTPDAGVSWQKVESGTTAMLTDGLRLADGTLVIVGLSGTVIISHDGGRSFALQEQADRKGLSAVLAVGAAQVLAVGESGARIVDLK
jgi:photosystem II stability/assembly factor-like uncharacterized protein